MSDENEGLVDLWGNPWTPEPDPRGRKRHRRDPQLAEKVAVLRATPMTEDEIAARVVLDPKTLRKYYSRELHAGPALAKAVLTEAIWEKAKGGNVSAARFIMEQFSQGETAKADQRVRERARETPPTPAALGKKEERKVAAEAVGGRFATPPAPTLIVNNG